MNKNLKIISFMFSFLFLVIISSLIYFLVFRSTYYSNHSLNKRISQERSKFIRGKILDRDGNVVAYTTEDGQKRIYPYGEALVHPIGYADIKYGMSGIENDMDEYLREPRGFISSIKSFFGYEDVHGSDVKLTIDSELQSYAYESLGNNKGAIVVMNPKTGEIYALVSKPSFDPNNLNEIWDSLIMEGTAPLYNRAINGKYPPGSTFKVITSASSIENIDGALNRKFNDDGFIDFNGVDKLYNQNRIVFGEMSLKDAFIRSSNVVFGNLALELGNSELKKYAERFYFNRDLDLKGLNVSNSYFPELNDHETGLIAQTGIGQGSILVTPINLALISSAIANNGIMMRPYIVDEVLNSYGDIINKCSKFILSKPIKCKTASIISSYMRGVVENNLSHISEFSSIKAAGKTGTADYKNGDEDGVPHSLFIGFAPYDNPKVSISVVVEGGGEGRGIASEISSNVMKKAIELIE